MLCVPRAEGVVLPSASVDVGCMTSCTDVKNTKEGRPAGRRKREEGTLLFLGVAPLKQLFSVLLPLRPSPSDPRQGITLDS